MLATRYFCVHFKCSRFVEDVDDPKRLHTYPEVESNADNSQSFVVPCSLMHECCRRRRDKAKSPASLLAPSDINIGPIINMKYIHIYISTNKRLTNWNNAVNFVRLRPLNSAKN